MKSKGKAEKRLTLDPTFRPPTTPLLQKMRKAKEKLHFIRQRPKTDSLTPVGPPPHSFIGP
ncbi:hypothetical protein ACLOJK_011818 [Asimina triloba]